MTLVLLIAAGFFVAACSSVAGAITFGIKGAFIVAYLTIICIGGGAFYAYSRLVSKAEEMCTPKCVCVHSAVGYLGWEGSCHTFEFTSSEYAFAFMMANQQKLVNVRPEVWQWFEARALEAQAPKQKSRKRRRK